MNSVICKIQAELSGRMMKGKKPSVVFLGYEELNSVLQDPDIYRQGYSVDHNGVRRICGVEIVEVNRDNYLAVF